jgi:apolipoprotein N-acyltransferase
MARWTQTVLSLVAGALLALAFAPFSLYPVAVLSLAILFILWDGTKPKEAAWIGWIFGLGFFGMGVSWVFVAIHVFGQSGLLLAGSMTFIFVAFLASYLALLGWLLRRFHAHSWSRADYLILLPLAWLVFELFKAWFLTGFPWLELGVSQIEGPMAGWIPIMGVSGVSLLIAIMAGALALLYKYRQLLWLMPIGLVMLAGQALKQVEWTQPDGQVIETVMIQGNVPQMIKWDREQLLKTMALYEQMTAQYWGADLVVWPENAIPAFYHQIEDFYLAPLWEKARQQDTEILLGLPVSEVETTDYYNALLLLGDTGKGFYYKRHLVPFGEYVPFEWLRNLINFFSLPMSSFSPGSDDDTLMHISGTTVGLSICYEDVFSSDILQSLPDSTVLVNATNNAWYGDSFAPQQHLQIARSRALEVSRPLVRSTTNGISAFVDHQGNIVAQMPQFERSSLKHDVQPRSGQTPYVWSQGKIFWVLALLLGVIWAYYRQKN